MDILSTARRLMLLSSAVLLTLAPTAARATVADCAQAALLQAPPELDLVLRAFATQTAVCFDRTFLNSDLSVQAAFGRLKREHADVVDGSHCINLTRMPDLTQNEDLRHLLRSAWVNLDQLRLTQLRDRPQTVYLSSSRDKIELIDTQEDLSQLFVNVAIGHQSATDAYRGERDKKLHANVGAAISLGTTGLTFALSDHLDLTYQQKRQLVRLSGPILGTVVGILKEIIYDKSGRGQVDKHDAVATAVGAGIIPVRLIDIRF